MAAVEHAFTPEELTAYVDGELSPEAARRLEAHVKTCDACRTVVDGAHEVTSALSGWVVEGAPDSLRAPRPTTVAPRAWRLALLAPRWVVIAAPAVLVIAAGLYLVTDRSRPATVSTIRIPVSTAAPRTNSPQATLLRADPTAARAQAAAAAGQGQAALDTLEQASSAQPPATLSGPLIVRTARLSLVVQDLDALRTEIERILRDSGGYAGRMDVSGARGAVRTLSATLRVPVARFDAALAAAKTLGEVIAESQQGDDVTTQAVDLEARLSNARNTESRLNDLLQHRTGDIADVLSAEREVARVREEIERMVAEQRSLRDRVAYATISFDAREQRKADLDISPDALSLSARFRNALVDGCRTALASLVDVALFGVAVLPPLLLWSLVGASLVWMVRRGTRRYFSGTIRSA